MNIPRYHLCYNEIKDPWPGVDKVIRGVYTVTRGVDIVNMGVNLVEKCVA